MVKVFRLMVDDYDPRIMEEDDMVEDLYDKIEELKDAIDYLIGLTEEQRKNINNHVKF